METKVFACLWDYIHEHQGISACYLQRKFKITCKEAHRYIREFLLKEIIPLHKIPDEQKYTQNTRGKHVSYTKKHKEKREKMILVVGGTKGGAGKSTIAINLVSMLASLNKNVNFVDGDEQKSSLQWSKNRADRGIETPWSYRQLSGREIKEKVFQSKSGYDHIIVDVGGRDTSTQRAILTIADYYLIPFKPGWFDLKAINDIKIILDAVLPANPRLPVYGVLNQADFKSSANDRSLNVIQSSGFIKPLNTIIRNRVSFRNCIGEGLSILEAKPKDQKAIDEMMSLYQEIYQEGA